MLDKNIEWIGIPFYISRKLLIKKNNKSKILIKFNSGNKLLYQLYLVLLIDIFTNVLSTSSRNQTQKLVQVIQWFPPLVHFLKCNTDTHIFQEEEVRYYGIVIHNLEGVFCSS